MIDVHGLKTCLQQLSESNTLALAPADRASVAGRKRKGHVTHEHDDRTLKKGRIETHTAASYSPVDVTPTAEISINQIIPAPNFDLATEEDCRAMSSPFNQYQPGCQVRAFDGDGFTQKDLAVDGHLSDTSGEDALFSMFLVSRSPSPSAPQATVEDAASAPPLHHCAVPSLDSESRKDVDLTGEPGSIPAKAAGPAELGGLDHGQMSRTTTPIHGNTRIRLRLHPPKRPTYGPKIRLRLSQPKKNKVGKRTK